MQHEKYKKKKILNSKKKMKFRNGGRVDGSWLRCKLYDEMLEPRCTFSYVRLLLTKPTEKLSRPTRQGKRGWNHQMILMVTVKRSTGV